jgi:ribosomal protein S18 acetylase RimI-like enzyme
MTIRRATVDDADALAFVHVSSWRSTYPGIVDQQYIDSLSVEDRSTAWRARLVVDPPTMDIFVADLPNRGIVGFVAGGRIRHAEPGFDAELYAIYLLKEAQRGGIGRQLTRAWAECAIERGFHAAVVRVLAANPACGFYERLGGRKIKEAMLTIAAREYPELWYAWDDLGVLAT